MLEDMLRPNETHHRVEVITGLSGRHYWPAHEKLRIIEETVAGRIRQAGIDGGARDDGPTSLEREELARLRKENRQLQMERDILSKGRSLNAPLVRAR